MSLNLNIKTSRVIWDDSLLEELYTTTEMPIVTIADVFQVKSDAVRDRLRKLGIYDFRDKHVFSGDGNPIPNKYLIELHQSGLDPVQISNKIKRNPDVVRNRLKWAGVYRQPRRTYKHDDPWDKYGDDEILEHCYLTNLTGKVNKKGLYGRFSNLPKSRVVGRIKQLDLPNRRRRLKEQHGIPDNAIISIYRSGKSLEYIAKITSRSALTIRDMLEANGIRIYHRSSIIPHIATCVDKYLNGYSLQEISRELRIDAHQIGRMLKGAGIKLRSLKEQSRLISLRTFREKVNTSELVYDYLVNKYGLTYLSNKYSSDYELIRDYLRFIGIRIRTRCEQLSIENHRNLRSHQSAKNILYDYIDKQLGIGALAIKYSVAPTTVSNILCAFDVKLRDATQQRNIVLEGRARIRQRDKTVERAIKKYDAAHGTVATK